MKATGKKSRAFFDIGSYVFVGLLLFLLSSSPLVKQSNSVLLDPLRTRDMEHSAVIIGIDDVTLKELGAWPLDRKVFADLIERLDGKGIKGLVFDVLFLEEKPSDMYMLKALGQASYPVVLGGKTSSGEILHPVYPLEGRVSDGFVNVLPDSDGKVRNFIPSAVKDNKCVNPLALVFFGLTNGMCFQNKTEAFFYPRTITEFSLVDVLNGKVPKELLEGKVLFVGATTLDLEDYFVGLQGDKIPGVYVHAAMYASHENNLSLKTLSIPIVGILLLIMMILGWAIVFYIRKSLLQVLALSGSLCLVVVSAALLFDFGFELPLLQLLITCITFFVVATLTRYAHSRRENTFIKSMFSRYVNKDVLHSLLKNSSNIKESERRHLSILFSDLRGFTDFSETLSPEELTGLLNEYFASMVTEIFKENGTVDKFIGDAVMAFWNAPLSVKHHELHATLAAIGMQEALSLFNEKHKTSLKMGIGVHAGEAVVGNIGGDERVSYTALGDSVNTASRIESITKKYGARIVISEEVATAVTGKLREGWRLRKLDEVKLKGKQNSVILYEVTTTPFSSIRLYEEAFAFYQKGDYKAATLLLQSDLLRGDTPASVLHARIQEGLTEEGFNGVWVFDEK